MEPNSSETTTSTAPVAPVASTNSTASQSEVTPSDSEATTGLELQDDTCSTAMPGDGGEADVSHDLSDDAEVVQRTTVEVYMEMVVCRKITTQQIDVKTGNVLHSSFTTEEDPPVVMDIHRVETTEDLTGDSRQSTSRSPKASANIARDVHSIVSSTRKVGGPFISLLKSGPLESTLPQQAALKIGKPGDAQPSDVKLESAGTASSTEISTNIGDSTNDTVDDQDDSQDTDNVSADQGETAQEKPASRETKIVKRLTRTTASRTNPQKGSTAKVKREPAVKRESIITTRRQAAGLTPSTPKSATNGSSDWVPKSAPPAVAVKRRRSGRPARTIKKPRKFESDAEEDEIHDEDCDAGRETQDEEETTGETGVENAVEQLQLEEGREVTEEEKALLENMITVTGRMCSTCGKRFSTVSGCVRHVQRGNCGPPISCKLCPKVLYSEAMMERHMQGHRDEDRDGTYKCADCNRTYATRGGYMKHKRQGTCFKRDDLNDDGTVGDFRCALCDTRFKTESLLKLHISKSHESAGSKFECKDCGRVFYSKQGFAKHESAKSCTQPLRCLVCGKMYSNKARESFKVHMKHHVAEAEGVQYQCEDCGRTYLTPEALRKHKVKHSEIRPHKCPTCSKSFPMRYMVREHMRTHTGDKPYLCNLCGTSFGNRGHLYRHIRSHELGTLHKRGRPRKNVGPILLKIAAKGKSGEGGEQELVMEDNTVSVMEIKSDPASAVQDASLMSGPTYITVHTADGEVMVDGEVTHSDGQAELTEGQLQHVVMQAEGMTEPMVIQVIRDLTGGATVYQQVETAGQTMVSTAQQHEVVEQEAVVTATTAATGVQRHIVVTSPRTQQSVQAESSSIVYRTT